jgi:hypothetical protein
MVLETLAFSPFNQLTRLVAREYFIGQRKFLSTMLLVLLNHMMSTESLEVQNSIPTSYTGGLRLESRVSHQMSCGFSTVPLDK